jgi:NitT/TauT family transport system substrate-binding protein
MGRFLAALPAAAIAAMCHWGAPAMAEEAVVLQLPWTHQANYGGFYLSERSGYFGEEGLGVQFLQGGPKSDPIAPVVDGQAQFGVADAAELLKARASGKDVRAIATIFRRSPVVFVAKAESGITKPEDFVGKTIRLTSVDSTNFYAMMKYVGIPADKFTIVNLPSDVQRFTSGEADVWSFYVTGLVVALEQAGIKLNYVYPDDYGVHFYGDTLFTTDRTIAANPDLVLRFLRASLKGWAKAVEDPGLIGPLVVALNPKADVTTETLKMRASQPLVNTGEDRIGWMDDDRWSRMASTLYDQGLLAREIDATDVFTLEFLRQAYGLPQ